MLSLLYSLDGDQTLTEGPRILSPAASDNDVIKLEENSAHFCNCSMLAFSCQPTTDSGGVVRQAQLKQLYEMADTNHDGVP